MTIPGPSVLEIPAILPFSPPTLMAEHHTVDLTTLDTGALKKRLTQLGRYL